MVYWFIILVKRAIGCVQSWNLSRASIISNSAFLNSSRISSSRVSLAGVTVWLDCCSLNSIKSFSVTPIITMQLSRMAFMSCKKDQAMNEYSGKSAFNNDFKDAKIAFDSTSSLSLSNTSFLYLLRKP